MFHVKQMTEGAICDILSAGIYSGNSASGSGRKGFPRKEAGDAAARGRVRIRIHGAHVPAALPPELCGASAPAGVPPGTQCAPASRSPAGSFLRIPSRQTVPIFSQRKSNRSIQRHGLPTKCPQRLFRRPLRQYSLLPWMPVYFPRHDKSRGSAAPPARFSSSPV